MRAALVGIAGIIFVAASFTGGAFAACGDRGGPGYRGPNGKCVGWEALARTCGNPPTTRCTPERPQQEADAAASKGGDIRKFMDDAHRRANER